MALKTIAREKKTICKPKACPTCGGLECFERPRFFCGQLLTDKDLDAAQRYVIEKNRLHNRYLVGTGVVCGLAVRCDPCDECAVIIEPGYAIDCCGNDIVLCEPAPFNVCEYIEKCLREKPVCEDKIRQPSRCDDLPKEYCLIVSYNEEPARPMTALIRDQGCSVTRCEPSRTKESFRFDLIESLRLSHKPSLTLLDRVCTCFNAVATDKVLLGIRGKLSPPPRTLDELRMLFSSLCDYVQKLYTKSPHNVRCNIYAELNAIEFPSQPHIPDDWSKLWTAFATLFGYVVQYLFDCICHELLVPCQECPPDDFVVLACLSVKGRTITRICNLVRRWRPSPLHQHQSELQTLNPLLLPFFHQGRLPNWSKQETLDEEVLERLCCEEDLTTIFISNEQPTNLEEVQRMLRKLASKLDDLLAEQIKICKEREGRNT